MTFSHAQIALFFTVAALLSVVSASGIAAATSSHSFFPGKNLHLSSQYRSHHQAFHEDRHAESSPQPHPQPLGENHLRPEAKFRHYELVNGHVQVREHWQKKRPNHHGDETPHAVDNDLKQQQKSKDDETETDRQEQPYKWVQYGKTLFKKHMPTITHNEELFVSVESDKQDSSTKSSNHDPHQEGWIGAIQMFAIWSLDNLFWLIPFVAYSPYNAVYFFVTYQALVIGSCIVGASHAMSFEEAHSLNTMWGGAGALFCWALTSFFYRRSIHQQQSNASTKKTPSKAVDEESGLSAPLLEEAAGNLVEAVAVTTPTAFLTVVMTVLAAVDDLFFIPVVLEKNMMTPEQIFFGSFCAVFAYTCLAAIVAYYSRKFTSTIPLYTVLGVYAAVMTGHSGWDFVTSHPVEVGMLQEEAKLRLGHISAIKFLTIFQHGK